jgi:hypothetical protein
MGANSYKPEFELLNETSNPHVILLTRAEVVYQTKNSSDLLMSSFAYSFVEYMCGIKRVGSRGRVQG